MQIVRTPLNAPLAGVAAVYLAAHIFLDWVSYINPFGATGITPWNPSTGLGFVLVCLFGRQMIGMIPLAAVLSNLLLRGPAEPLLAVVVQSAIVGIVYPIAILALLHPRLKFNPALSTVSDLVVLVGTAILSSAVVASLYVGLLTGMGLLETKDILPAALRYWVGDMIGIAVVTPFGLLALTRGPLFTFNRQTILQIAAIVAMLWFSMAFAEFGRLKNFHLLFFPVIWIALSTGIEGTSAALVFIQFGLFVAVRLLGLEYLDITDFQARMFVLTVTGLVAGALVTERRRAEEQLRQQQEALAQVATRGSMGELGAAIAHEVNQPLSAAATYAGLVAESLATESLQDGTALDNARKAARQIERASQVVRRVRALVRLAQSDVAPVPVDRIVQEVMDLMQADTERSGIALRTDVARNLPAVMADRLQIEQALVNLVRNAIDAIQSSSERFGSVTIYAYQAADDSIEIGVKDTGPGFPAGFTLDTLQPFASKKADGLGIGLSLCRSIALAHGGRLRLHTVERGGQVSINLWAPGRSNDGRH